MQLRDATVQAAQAPQAAAAAGAAAHASGPRGTAHGSCRLPEDLRQKLLQTLQRVALCDFQLLEWMGRAVPWTATAARAMQQAADAASGNTARTEKPCVQGAQQVMQPAQLPQQQQRFLGTLPQRDEAGVIESLELAWAKQLHGWLLRQPGRRALSIDVLSAGLGAPGPVFKALGRKPYRCWQRHPQLWEYHKHPRGMSELRAVVPTHGGGTSSSAPAAGRHATRAAGGDELAPRDYRQLAQAEARYVRELYAFLIRHPEGFEARELTRHNMDVPAAILRERKISTFLKYYQHLGIFRINNPPLGAPPEPLTVWAVRGRRAEEALEEVFDRLVASGERRQMDGGGR
ncbi:hypothetical protein HXX76_001876 [Chlamydomonas incerta]|uniref:Uncharacterized protein n=1 Tax=Chlamydomonas incerta TaxID=51695 RepID=A0A835TMP6_CHLIN|nr:hypothetical protein HXX76_001876 [Chlamydomonas incerta]|eukprot:KAG2443524.1 hypothetical protein HXX76_001876 [Chlamydomonas incerta]